MAFLRACALADIKDDAALGVTVDGQDVALARHGDEVLAIEDMCSHASVALSAGDYEISDGDCTVECWLHGSRVDLRPGKPTGLPATEPVATFPVDVRDGDVYVDVETFLNGVTPQ
jgi:3-phenylpropionate/trans-cinnamate dioxygenase ferredoxin subunit